MKRIIFFLSLLLTSCNYFSRQTIQGCKPGQILLSTIQYQGMTFSDTIKTWFPVDTQNYHNDSGIELIPDSVFQKFKVLIDTKLIVPFDYEGVIFYNKGRLKNTSNINLNNAYGLSFYSYIDGKEKLLNFRTFLLDTIRDKFIEINELNSNICGIVGSYPFYIAKEVIPQLSGNWSNSLVIFSNDIRIKYKNFKISTTYQNDHFVKNLEDYTNKLFYKKYFNKIQ